MTAAHWKLFQENDSSPSTQIWYRAVAAPFRVGRVCPNLAIKYNSFLRPAAVFLGVPAVTTPVANPPAEAPPNDTPVLAGVKPPPPTAIEAVVGSVGGVVNGKLEAQGCKAVPAGEPAGADQVCVPKILSSLALITIKSTNCP